MIGGERGAALVLALVTLVGLTALALALLAISALDPQISPNHADVTRARYLAEAGLEHAVDVLASTAGAWDSYLTDATCTMGAILAHSTLPGAGPAYGAFTVRVRNDCAPGDDRLTGTSSELGIATRDTNGKVIVGSTGATGSTVQTVTAVISYNGPASQPGQNVARSEVTAYGWIDQ